MSAAAYRHHPRILTPFHPAKKEACEGKVTEMIGPKLQLEPVRRNAPRRRHHPSVVDQQIEPLMLPSEPLREPAH